MGRRYALGCILSGYGWAGIAFLILGGWAWKPVIGGIVVAPLIGLFVGALYVPVCGWPPVGRAFVALVTLYLAVTLFGAAMGVMAAATKSAQQNNEVVFECIAAPLWGLTCGGWVLILWPVAFYNNERLRRYA